MNFTRTSCAFPPLVRVCRQSCNIRRQIEHVRRLNAQVNVKPIKKLFTPGPLLISQSTKEAMLRDLGSRDTEFMELVKRIEQSVLDVAFVAQVDYTTVILQGSGTYAIEAVIRTATPPEQEVLIVSNGFFGRRMDQICESAGLRRTSIHFPDTERIDIETVENHLKSKNQYACICLVHCETVTGLVNDVKSLITMIKRYCPDSTYIVDAMSSFGAIPLSIPDTGIDYLVTSANKCLQGVPGFALVIARLEKLIHSKGNCESLSLDLEDQYRSLATTGQFRFTPPTHTLLAMDQALKELHEEGGVTARGKRYQLNCRIIRSGMKRLGFREYAPYNEESFILTAYLLPPKFSFQIFYEKLNAMDQVIFFGKLTSDNIFRIGHIGNLNADDSHELLKCIEKACLEMGITLPVQY